jgi:hypothetical protein
MLSYFVEISRRKGGRARAAWTDILVSLYLRLCIADIVLNKLIILSVAGFKALADLIASFPTLSQHSQFIFVPGPTDPWTSSTLPRPAIPQNFVQPILSKVPRAVFTSNPARIQYFNQEIVIFREDLMGRMLRNLVQVKDGVDGANMKRYVSTNRL